MADDKTPIERFEDPAEHRRAGQIGIPMRWNRDLPWAGDFLINRNRRKARYGYRIVAVDRFETPRGRWRFNGRLWCERVLPEDVRQSKAGDRAQVHTFWWFPRGKRERSRAYSVP